MMGSSGPSIERIHSLASDSSISSTTAASIAGIAQTLEPGTYWFEYSIDCESATATVTPKFGINFTGTQTRIAYSLFFPSAGVTAATGVVDQDANATTGQVWAHASTRTNNTVLGPFTDVDTTNSPLLMYLKGKIVVTAAGTLQFLHGSETATSTTVKAGTMLRIIKVL